MPVSERPLSIERLLSEHRRIALDSNALIYLLESAGPRADLVAALVDAFAEREAEGVLSTVALTEVLTGPARSGDLALFDRMAEALRDLPCRWVAPDARAAEEAAWIRGGGRLGLGDALHLATARVAGATCFVTNDRDLVSTPKLTVVYLDDLLGA